MSVRNRNFVPELDREGVFARPLDVPKDRAPLRPFERMHAHHTLASARRFALFRPFSGLIPGDELDFVLAAPYDHSVEVFAEPVDALLQAETLGAPTWRRLRNSSDLKPSVEARAKIDFRPKDETWTEKLPYKLNKAHPVVVSGIIERRHPSNVKLMNSSHHSPQTNAGYSRQDSDGNCYHY